MARRIESSSDSIEGSCAVFTLPMPPHFTRITFFCGHEIARILPQGKLRHRIDESVIDRNRSVHGICPGADPFVGDIEIIMLDIVENAIEGKIPRRHMAD